MNLCYFYFNFLNANPTMVICRLLLPPDVEDWWRILRCGELPLHTADVANADLFRQRYAIAKKRQRHRTSLIGNLVIA